MRIIPAMDILNQKCVRLTQGNYNLVKTYDANPIELAKKFADNGFEYLHLVDLDGAKSNHIVNYKILEKIVNHTNLRIDFGGGIKSTKDLEIAFNCGAQQVTAGSVAVQNPNLFLEWLDSYGQDKIILGADAHQRKIAFHGWLKKSNIDLLDFIKEFEQKGVKYVICTDIAKDGLLAGPALELYKEIKQSTSVNLIASGGISCLNDIINSQQLGCEAVIIGKAIYEGKITLTELQNLC